MKPIMLFVFCACLLTACRGDISSKPPLHGIRNMDLQPRYGPQAPNAFYSDGRSAQLPVAGTVERGGLESDHKFYAGENPDGSLVAFNPQPITLELLRRGRERFDIYCTPCHDRVGTGKGLVITKPDPKFPPPPSLHEERIRRMPDGELFKTLSGGIRTMPSYRHQIPAADRWAIVAYVRALERSQYAALEDLRPDEREKLKQ